MTMNIVSHIARNMQLLAKDHRGNLDEQRIDVILEARGQSSQNQDRYINAIGGYNALNISICAKNSIQYDPDPENLKSIRKDPTRSKSCRIDRQILRCRFIWSD